jgi:hypothetical protein
MEFRASLLVETNLRVILRTGIEVDDCCAVNAPAVSRHKHIATIRIITS